ncbi:MAG: flagellar protein FlgJ [Enterobacterales bacterium]|jgi:flagellar protein FlgJ
MITPQSTGTEQFDTSRLFHDFNSLNALKEKKDSPETIREAAKQFESIFMGMMLKSMREANAAIVDEPLLDSAQLGMYQDMYDEQLTLHLGSTSGLGLTDILVQQLGGVQSSESKDKVADKEFNPRRATRANYLTPVKADNSDILAVIQASQAQPKVKDIASNITSNAEDISKQVTQVNSAEQLAESNNSERGLDFSSPTSFVSSLWPYAQKAAEVLQLDPKMLIAQAALETGWGKHVMRTEQGSSSKNLFGIKASQSWQGQRTEINTLEVEDGAFKRQKAEFRTYESYADSFKDYVNFISDKPRYQKAVDVASKPENYTKELQDAGYATDPNYANKINDIYNSPTINNALTALMETP